MKSKILLLVNTGTPGKPQVKEVRRFLSEFLNDRRVIDLPWLIRKVLVNLVIVPFRAPRSARLYQKLWTDNGSPLLNNLNRLVIKVQSKVNDEYQVYGAMRYGEPSLENILNRIKNNPPDELVIFPLYPHFASSTTGSVNEFILKKISRWNTHPAIRFVGQFYSDPFYLDTLVNQINRYDPLKFDHILFSYHGLPLSHIKRIHPAIDSTLCKCSEKMPGEGTFCYKATCYETSRLLAHKLNLISENFSSSFQSRFSKNWLTPFTDNTIRDLARSGKKRILVVAPSFVADCLETIIEIKEEYQNIFKAEGGHEIVLVESLNENDQWAEAIIRIVASK